MSENPFEDETFIQIMKGILDFSGQNKNAICSAMGLVDKETDPVPYYTLDCALCYLTYMEIKEEHHELRGVVKKLVKRTQKNLAIMEEANKGS